MQCPDCGKTRIKFSASIALCTYPPQYSQKWWCKCGHTEPAGPIYGKTEAQINLEQWEIANAM